MYILVYSVNMSLVCSYTWCGVFVCVFGADAEAYHSWWVAVGPAGDHEDRLIHKQQRWREIPAAGEREQRAAEDHPGGSVSSSLCPAHCWGCLINTILSTFQNWIENAFDFFYANVYWGSNNAELYLLLKEHEFKEKYMCCKCSFQ